MALDSSGNFLYIADRDNNAIRVLDLEENRTYTLAIPDTNVLNKPIGIAIDALDNVYVLNYGNGKNGNILEFDGVYAELVATNAAGLTNAAGIALDANATFM